MYKAVILGNTKLKYSWYVLTHKQGLKLNGWDVLEIDYKSNSLQTIKKRILDYKPNVIFTHLSFHSHIYLTNTILNFFKDIKSKINVRVVHSCNDARTNDRYMGDIRGVFDVAFVGTYPMVRNCQNAFKVPVFYSPYSALCYDKMANFAPDLAFDIPVFTGSPGAHRAGWADDRAGFIEKLQNIMPIKIFKTQSGNDLRHRTPELSVSAKCILGLCVGYEIDGYIDVRPFQYLGTGAFMIMRKFMNMEKIIPDDLYIPFYNYKDPNLVKELWNKYKNQDMSKMKKMAFNYIQSHHSCKIRIENELNILSQI